MADAVAAEGLDNLKAFHIEDQKWRKLQLESVLHRKRVFVPKVDPQNPFRAETQLMDQYELRELNRVRVCLAPRLCWCLRRVSYSGCACVVRTLLLCVRLCERCRTRGYTSNPKTAHSRCAVCTDHGVYVLRPPCLHCCVVLHR